MKPRFTAKPRGLVLVWLVLVVLIGREHKKLTAEGAGVEA